MKHLAFYLATLLSGIAFPLMSSKAQGTIVGLDTNGIVFQITPKTGALTEVTEEALSSYSLGGTTRKGNVLYYVAKPRGSSEYALYRSDVKKSTLSHIDLDRNEAVKNLFFVGKKLYGVFYDGASGVAALYQINSTTGATSLLRDFSALDVEPIAGAMTKLKDYYYLLVKPESDTTRRQLLKFKLRGGTLSLVEILDSTSLPVLCDKIKANPKTGKFLCLASAASETQVNFCQVNKNGKTKCVNTLSGILRIGSGHTFLAASSNSYYAFAYVPGEPNNQRLLQLNGKGVIKSSKELSTISIGAHLSQEAEE